MYNLKFFLKYSLLFLILMIFLSCEEDFQDFPTISYNPCEIEDVIINPNFITDFECQSNFILNNVETVRNPSETPLNTSNFVGLYTDTQQPTDFIEIDYGSPIDYQQIPFLKLKSRLRFQVNSGLCWMVVHLKLLFNLKMFMGIMDGVFIFLILVGGKMKIIPN